VQVLLKQVAFFGHVISKGGILVDLSKIQDMLSWNAPASVANNCSFLGLASYYRRFIEGFLKIAMPMTELLRKDKKFVGVFCIGKIQGGLDRAFLF
jgi:hypothetical protein